MSRIRGVSHNPVPDKVLIRPKEAAENTAYGTLPEFDCFRPMAIKDAPGHVMPFQVWVFSGCYVLVDTSLPWDFFYMLKREEYEALFSEAFRADTNIKLNDCVIYPPIQGAVNIAAGSDIG